MNAFGGPRHLPARAALTGAGLPGDRMARLAARRAFLELKQTYLQAIEPLPGPRADWLRHQVRRTQEPADLWMLRAAVFEALPPQECRAQRERLQHGIDTVFPRSAPDSGFASLL